MPQTRTKGGNRSKAKPQPTKRQRRASVGANRRGEDGTIYETMSQKPPTRKSIPRSRTSTPVQVATTYGRWSQWWSKKERSECGT